MTVAWIQLISLPLQYFLFAGEYSYDSGIIEELSLIYCSVLRTPYFRINESQRLGIWAHFSSELGPIWSESGKWFLEHVTFRTSELFLLSTSACHRSSDGTLIRLCAAQTQRPPVYRTWWQCPRLNRFD